VEYKISDKIHVARFILVVGLIWVHFGAFPGESLSPFTGVVDPTYYTPSFLNSFFTYFFLSSVPLLSFISGYLFLNKGIPAYKGTLIKKANTVLLPSLIWSGAWVCIALALYILGKPYGLFTDYEKVFSELNAFVLIDQTIGFTESPLAFQFWFINDLLLSIIISPILIYLLQRFSWILILALTILWLAEVPTFGFYNYKVILYFCIGLLFQIKQYKVNTLISSKIFAVAFPIFISLTVLRIVLPAHYDGDMPFETSIEFVLRMAGAVAMINIIFNLDKYTPALFSWVRKHSHAAFFIFAAHFPFIMILKQALFKVGIFNSEIGFILLWLVTPFLCLFILLIASNVIKISLPKLYFIINGQRIA